MAKVTTAQQLEADRCRAVLREMFAATPEGRGPRAVSSMRPLIVTDFSRSVRRCRVLLPQNEGRDGLKVVDVTYFVARAAGASMNDRGLAFGGGGYSAALEAWLMLMRAIGADTRGPQAFDELRVG